MWRKVARHVQRRVTISHENTMAQVSVAAYALRADAATRARCCSAWAARSAARSRARSEARWEAVVSSQSRRLSVRPSLIRRGGPVRMPVRRTIWVFTSVGHRSTEVGSGRPFMHGRYPVARPFMHGGALSGCGTQRHWCAPCSSTSVSVRLVGFVIICDNYSNTLVFIALAGACSFVSLPLR